MRGVGVAPGGEYMGTLGAGGAPAIAQREAGSALEGWVGIRRVDASANVGEGKSEGRARLRARARADAGFRLG